MFLEKILKNINNRPLPPYRYEKGRQDLRALYLEVFSILTQEDFQVEKGKFLWLGYDGDNFHGALLDSPDYVSLHEKHKTDSNLLIGYFNYSLSGNKFNHASEVGFFVDSWNGSFWGKYQPFKIESDHLHQPKKVA